MKIPHWYVVIRQFFQPYYIPNPKYYTAPVPEREKPLTEKIAKVRQEKQKAYVLELTDDLRNLSRKIKSSEKGSKKRKKLVEKRKKLREEYDSELTELNNLREFLGLKPIHVKQVQKKSEKEKAKQEAKADEVSRDEAKQAEKSPQEDLELKRRPTFNRKRYKELLKKGKEWYESNNQGKYDLKVVTLNYPKPLNDVEKLDVKPELDMIFAYHDKNLHQVLGHFAPRSGYRYGKDTRNNNKRKSLFPLVFPKYVEDKPFDRTHLIPFGYHNTENDKRILIGWDSWQNRNPLNEWETKAKEHNQNIYWLASVEKTEFGADWHYKIFDEEYNLLDRLDVSMGTAEEPIEFAWKDGYYNDTEIWTPQKRVVVINHG